MNQFKYIPVLVVVLLSSLPSVQGQTRKYISQFSHFQSYFNPGLTGYEGSTVRGFVRNQWSGIEGAPKTVFFSTEMDFGELAGESDPALMGKNSVSVNLLQDTYGAFRETELMVGYASRIRLSQAHNLRLGVGINYQSIRLDGNALTVEEQNDPALGRYVGSFTDMQVLDFNLGIALTHANYYVSYGMHRVNGGKKTSGDAFMTGYPSEKLIQAGYREFISPGFSLITNVFYRSQRNLPDNFEFNLKALLMDRIWIGAGHRIEYAYNLQFGVVTSRLKLGYIYEFPLSGSYLMSATTHEFTAVFNLFGKNEQNKFAGNRVLIW
jgi:type IX secretion system PorP/SprF family membrane protein